MNNPDISRRIFLKKISKYGLILGGSAYFLSGDLITGDSHFKVESGKEAFLFFDDLVKNSKPARFWTSTNLKTNNCTSCHAPSEIRSLKEFEHDEVYIKCLLCAQGCILKEGERGKCRARMNINGELRSLVYGRPISTHIDPIEKKPFYHYLPGSQAFSLATAGCPLNCQFCQNWEISQAKPEDYPVEYTPPETIVSTTQNRNVPIIAFTYNEPTVFTEYLLDIAKDAKEQSIRSVLISCGFMNEQPLTEMCQVLDAIKIDLKGFSKEFYRNVSKAELDPVLRSIKQIAKSGIHLEIVNLVVPTLNDSEKMLDDLANWIINEVGPDVPVHFTRFHPDYKLLNLPPTPIKTLELARDIAMDKGINYAFVGNVPGHKGNNTYCPSCGQIVIERTHFFVVNNNVIEGKCKYCNYSIAGVWK